MRRITRALFIVAAVTSLALGFAPSSKAVSSLAYTFAINCADTSEQWSVPDLPSGTYTATVTGVCTLDGNLYTQTVDTCSVTPSPAPCLPVGPIQRVPGEACWTTTNGHEVRQCDQDGSTVLYDSTCDGVGHLVIDDECRLGETFSFFRSGHGQMKVRWADSWPADNNGVLVVTLVWTP